MSLPTVRRQCNDCADEAHGRTVIGSHKMRPRPNREIRWAEAAAFTSTTTPTGPLKLYLPLSVLYAILYLVF